MVSVPEESPHPPKVKTSSQTIKVTESDKVGFLISLIEAADEDNDTLWYDIIGKFNKVFLIILLPKMCNKFVKFIFSLISDGNENNDFFIGSENGNVHLAKKLLWEKKSSYVLNISVTDGVHQVYTQVRLFKLFNN